jgi:hypothetical protein
LGTKLRVSNQQPSTPTGELRRRLIRALVDENVRVPMPAHVVVNPTT